MAMWQRRSAIALVVWLSWGLASVAVEPELPSVLPPGTSATEPLEQGLQQFQAQQVEAAIAIWEAALVHYRQGQSPDKERQTLARLGMAYVSVGQYHKAIQRLEAFLPLARSPQDQAGEAEALSNLGIAYQETGRYGQAIATQQQAGKLMLALGDRPALGQVLSNLGNAFEAVGAYDKARVAYQQSLKIAQQAGDRRGEGIALGNLGTVYANLGQDPEAIAAFDQSLKLAQALNDATGQTSALLNLGSAHHALRQLDQAIAFYEQSLQRAQATGDRANEARVLGSLGLAYEDKKDFPKALAYQQQSLALARSLNDPEAQSMALNNLAHTQFEAGQLAEAEANLRAAIRLLDGLRPELNDAYKVSIFDTQIHTYSLLQQVLVSANNPEAALEAAEWGRARAFSELLAQRVTAKTKATAQPPQTPAAIAPALTITDIKRIAREQNATLVEYAIVPDADFKFRGKQRAREAELLIWVVPPTGQVQLRQVDLKPLWQQDLTLRQTVAIARECLYPPFSCPEVQAPTPANAPPAQPAPVRRKNPALHRLHQLLIAPIADLLPRDPQAQVIFIPQDSLFLVPFVALQDDDGKYLLEHHTVSTAPAIQVLGLTHQLRQQQAQTAAPTPFTPAVVVGNPTMPRLGEQSLAPLPLSETEAQKIAALVQSTALIGDAATKQTVMQRMAQAKLIHLATHGLLEYGQDLGETDVPGAIALAPDAQPTGKAPNGLLTASEILNLQLQAELVVLSACDTGRGRITGDGVIGLSRAFISAGTPSILVSLWAVPDGPTAELMVAFYQNLQRQPNKAQALRSAMLATMENYPRPLDWAAFTLVGAAN